MEILALSGREKADLREFYDPGRWPEITAYLPRMMRALLDVLEEVEHPAVRGYTSLWMLLLTEWDDFREWPVTVSVEHEEWMERPRFRVTHALPGPWYSATAFAEEAGDAAELVMDGLRRAERGKRRKVESEW